jgi:hypothetical protein
MIYHFFTSYSPSDPDTARRHRIAQMTWPRQPWQERPIEDRNLPRLWRERGRSYPYVIDLFDAGCALLPDDAIMVFTNTDILVRGDACLVIAEALQGCDACYAFRRDFHHRFDTPIPDKDFEKGLDYAGSDLAAFRVGWWRDNRKEMPDMIIGFEAWDTVLRTLIEETNPGVQPLRDIICHERHGSYWENPAHRYKLASQNHNLGLAKAFLMERGLTPGNYCIR